jgi:pyruvate-ferredoxin/flavodoxin oxidoreductase
VGYWRFRKSNTTTTVIKPLTNEARTLDANEAVASVAYRLNEIFAIYPITPSSAMGEWVDEWAAAGRKNLWGQVPDVAQFQSEGGAAGGVHGALQAGALAGSFTASQGLLLFIPNLYKIAGELHPCVIHVTARTLATHALSIFGDHSDVMACRQTGWAMLCSNDPQEAHDLAAIAQAATLVSRVPFLHFFDGFRTSHEIQKVVMLSDDDLRALIDEDAIRAHRARGMTPDNPSIRGTAQNPDVFFQAREAASPNYAALPAIVQETMDRFAEITGRTYNLFDYEGHPEAERVVVLMGSGCGAAAEAVEWLVARGEKVGIVKPRLFRAFDVAAFLKALPKTVRSIAVLDRTKEPGAIGDPLYLDVITALVEGGVSPMPRVVGGRYGLGSKEFTPAMVKAVLDELSKEKPANHFTVGIVDDVSGSSLAYDADFDTEPDSVTRAVFYGLGSDGTVGANKNSIKIIGEETSMHGQGFFVYDSKKSGAMTTSHLRFGPRPIRSTYLIRRANFVAVHQSQFLGQLDVLGLAREGATLLLNIPGDPASVWDKLPREVQEQIIAKKLKVHVIDAYAVAKEAGMIGQVNTVMQTCFFALAGILPRDEAIGHIKKAIRKTYGRKGEEIVRRNEAAVDASLASLHEMPVPGAVTSTHGRRLPVAVEAPDFVQRVTARILAGEGDLLPVSAFTADGTWPTGTARWEKRNLAHEIPVWDTSLCIQCNKCALVCPHAAIRTNFYPTSALAGAPEGFKSAKFRSSENPGCSFTVQVAPEDCTGCTLCAQVCPARDKSNLNRKALMMQPQEPLLEQEKAGWDFFLKLPQPDRAALKFDVKGSQFREPLFEFSGACAGCGETPYIKLLTQLLGDRLLIANATGCSSIYGGNLPTTPYRANAQGRGPAWSNSLFEDNAEYGLGLRLAVDQHEARAAALLRELAPRLGDGLAEAILGADQSNEAGVAAARRAVLALKGKLAELDTPVAAELAAAADYLVKKSVWIVGGDGWAYDIGYGGLDHVIASGRNVKILVLDTEVYSNTGGQKSKSTPLSAVAKFSVAGKATPKKDLAMMAANYANVYVARVALGARDIQTLQAFREAEAHPGPAIIIAYSHCIAHGYALSQGLNQQKLAVETGTWPLFRFDPNRPARGEPDFLLDSAAPKVPLSQYTRNEIRFQILNKSDPGRAKLLAEAAQKSVNERWVIHEQAAAGAKARLQPETPEAKEEPKS